ncbi:unnamed protein product, partial [Prorocentrum cordatum]
MRSMKQQDLYDISAYILYQKLRHPGEVGRRQAVLLRSGVASGVAHRRPSEAAQAAPHGPPQLLHKGQSEAGEAGLDLNSILAIS